MGELKEIRCPFCKHMLMKAESVGKIQVKCTSCKRVLDVTDQEVTLAKDNPKKLIAE